MKNKFFSISTIAFCILLLASFTLVVHAQNAKKSLTVEEMDRYREEVRRMISFLELSLNTLGDPEVPFQDKDVIISQSYQKLFLHPKVQIEDDLLDNRDVVTNKDVQAYLKDVDFFFKNVRFSFVVNDIVEQRTEDGALSFRVRMNRTIDGLDISGVEVNNTKPRFVEINVDEVRRDIKIVSIYTTRLSEKEELANWWNNMSFVWRNILGRDLAINDTLTLADVQHISDKQVMVNNEPFQTDIARMFGTIKRAARRDSLNVSGMATIHDLSPLTEMDGLLKLNISNTGVRDLLPLRSLTTLQELYLSNTSVDDLNPLRYTKGMRVLDISNTSVHDLSPIENFDKLERLYAHNTVIDSLDAIAYINTLEELYIYNTNITDISFAEDLKSLRRLNFSNTMVAKIAPLKNLKALEKIEFENTPIVDLSPLSGHPRLSMIVCNYSKVKDLMPLAKNAALEAIYCDETRVTRQDVMAFLAVKPDCEVIFNTEYLVKWWIELPGGWKRSIAGPEHAVLANNKEKIHQLLKKQELDVSGAADVENLEPLRLFYGLKRLNCENTPLTNIDALANQTDLLYLNCSQTLIEDISSLSRLQKLEVLRMSQTKVADLSPLSSLKSLDTLIFSRTMVNDASVIGELQSLRYADFRSTGVSAENVAQIGFDQEKLVLLFQEELLNSWWVRLPESWRSHLNREYKTGLNPGTIELHALAARKDLSLKSLEINALEPVSMFYRLKKLDISGSRISNLGPLSNLNTLEELDASRVPVEDLQALSGLTQLRVLLIEQTPVGDLKALSRLINLEILRCSGTSVRDLSPLSDLKNLKELDCANTRVRNLKGLDSMPSLRVLKVYNNSIAQRRIDDFKRNHPECDVVFY